MNSLLKSYKKSFYLPVLLEQFPCQQPHIGWPAVYVLKLTWSGPELAAAGRGQSLGGAFFSVDSPQFTFWHQAWRSFLALEVVAVTGRTMPARRSELQCHGPGCKMWASLRDRFDLVNPQKTSGLFSPLRANGSVLLPSAGGWPRLRRGGPPQGS